MNHSAGLSDEPRAEWVIQRNIQRLVCRSGPFRQTFGNSAGRMAIPPHAVETFSTPVESLSTKAEVTCWLLFRNSLKLHVWFFGKVLVPALPHIAA
jgi:hypothetical protein